MATTLRYCPKCNNHLVFDITEKSLVRICRKCAYKEEEAEGGLVLETVVQEKASEAYKVLLNEFTRQDPTLPHVQNIPCPNEECMSRKGVDRPDVIIIKSDLVNLKYIYICNVCSTQWRSRS